MLSPSSSSSTPSTRHHHVALHVEQETRVSWIDIRADVEDHDLDASSLDPDFLPPRNPPFPSQSASSLGFRPMHVRPRAPTPSASVPVVDDSAWSPVESALQPKYPSSSSIPDSPTPANHWPPRSSSHSQLTRSISEGETSFLADSAPSFVRPSKSLALPDPSQFPDPYPFRPPHHHLTSTIPALSSGGSSSTSTRSSAYTSSGSALASGDYGHVHVVSGEDENNIGVGITSDSVVQLLASDGITSGGLYYRAPIDQTRWSESYSGSVRSRSSSVGNGDVTGQRLHEKPSYDNTWQPVDERDEVGVSEEETDEDQGLEGDVEDEDEDDAEKEEERTAAVVVAEEGRGLIVQGEGLPIVQLQVQYGTTHLLIGSSATPNTMPSFLTTTLPQISSTLLALDISANFLGALPPCLAGCAALEELNVASNPLRVLPTFLSELAALRVLIADSTGITTLPDTLGELDKLHTLSIRRNKMHALPSWLCLLSTLETLYVDGNPFQGPWKALVEPLLAKNPMTPIYPPSTPIFPLPSAISSVGTETEENDADDSSDPSDPPSASSHSKLQSHLDEEDYTITPARPAFTPSTVSAPLSGTFSGVPAYGLTRTRTTPNRPFYDRAKGANGVSFAEPKGKVQLPKLEENSGQSADRQLRKMKSAGELRRGAGTKNAPPPLDSGVLGSRHPISASSSNLLSLATLPEHPSPKRFASLGPSSGLNGYTYDTNRPRGALTQSLWDDRQEPSNDARNTSDINITTSIATSASPVPLLAENKPSREQLNDTRVRPAKESKDKGSRWGFLKKMSMGKLKLDSPIRSSTSQARMHPLPRPQIGSMASSTSTLRLSGSPQIDVRFSTTGTLGALPTTSISSISPPASSPLVSLSPPEIQEEAPQENVQVAHTSSGLLSPNLLSPHSVSPRPTKRRSFLPIDTPLSLNTSVTNPATFMPGVTATNGTNDSNDVKAGTPSPAAEVTEFVNRKEEERAREAYTRALRSVMAYLRDMNDLGLSQSNSMSVYGGPTDEVASPRSRRPTDAAARELSVALGASASMSTLDASQLRSYETMAGLRSGTSSQTMSVATTDSSSSEERKFKDDKGKRAMVVREIIETERTYAKGLQELVDIYIKPGATPVNLITGVGSSKETIIPANERKIVFGGVDALFSFHHESFLPALEVAAAPLMKSSALPRGTETDTDGQLSLNVARAVGSVFLKHAAFLKMYSSYINNFENSVQRVKHWTSDRPTTTGQVSPGSAVSPSSSTAQLVGLGLSMSAISIPGVMPEAASITAGLPHLTTSQRRRIKSYLKRCRMNPRHSQLNLEGYLLLPVQRIPRYRLLLEELVRSTPPTYEYIEDPLDKALAEISSLANNMNEGKRESESRRKLVQWQSRIRGKFPSPLVQPHRRLIMDGPLLLTRVVRKAVVSFEAFNAQGDSSTVQVDCLAPELTPRQLIGILCNDLLVLCRDPSDGQDPTSQVDLWAVLRMQTLPQPASIVHGNALRLVDNKAILYFDTPTSSAALNWFRAINLHIPASKT